MHPIMVHLLPSVPRQVHRSRYRTRYKSFLIASLFLFSPFRFVFSLFSFRLNFRFVSFFSYSITQILSRLYRYSTVTYHVYSLLNNIEVIDSITLIKVYITAHTIDSWLLISCCFQIFVIVIFAFFVFLYSNFFFFFTLSINYKININELSHLWLKFPPSPLRYFLADHNY